MKSPNRTSYAFIFLEIFSQEGGIQSYIKDVLRAYLSVVETMPCPPQTDIFLLRDASGCDNLFETKGMQFHYCQSRRAWQGRLKLSASLIAYLLQHRPQQVFCGHIKLAPLIRLLCQPLGIPYTVLTYGKEVWNPLPPLERQALQQSEAIWTISRYSRDRLTKANAIPPHRVQILPCVVDGTRFTPGPKPPELLAKYGLKDALVLMSVARLWSGDIYKGVDVTIRALPQIVRAFPTIKYLIIGRGDDRPRLESLAQELGVGDRVVFAGFVPTENLVEHYRLADVYVMPSQEGFGIVYLEAMACGVPVVSGDADGSADPLQDAKLGWRVPHRDPHAVARACIEILQQCDRRCQGDWLRQETLAHFSPIALSKKLQTLVFC